MTDYQNLYFLLHVSALIYWQSLIDKAAELAEPYLFHLKHCKGTEKEWKELIKNINKSRSTT